MLKEMINGNEVICTPEKEKLIRDFWALNDKYPEYAGHLIFDWVNPADHDMTACRQHHDRLTRKAIELARTDLNKQIELAEETNDDATKKQLLAQRAKLRNYENTDFLACKTVDDLRNSIAEEIKPYWNK